MTRDYRRGSVGRPSVPRRKQGQSCIWSFLLGGMLGAFIVGFFWVQNPDAVKQPEQSAAEPSERPTLPPSPSFEFPHLFRDTEVDIGTGAVRPPPPPAPRPEPQAVEPVAPVAPAAPVAAAGRGVLIQVASFGRGADAERLKAELALLGIPSRVEVATVASGQTYHRVRTGPYASPSEVDRVRALLQRHGHEAMTIRVP
ncbi:SPOR domain-containing protein [Thiocapsa imhoffii]|nr:SPOR domain-containing protein [Thiocapsa imhoffii]